jgi:hypothetical protein
MFSRELKKGSTELLILALLDGRPRHGYELGKLIESRSGGRLRLRVGSLYPILCRLEDRGLITGRWVEKAGERAPPALLPPDLKRPGVTRRAARRVEGLHRRRQRGARRRTCLTGRRAFAET